MDNAIVATVSDFYTKCLSAPECVRSAEYLQNRGIDITTATEWKIGASLPTPDLLPKAIAKKGLSIQTATDLNVLYENQNGLLKDRMFGRIAVTIFSDYGEPISICGRAISDDTFPKYLFLPHTSDFNKDHTLYGLERAYKSIFKAGFAVLTEGFFDVIQAHSIGLRNTVATCGVHLSDVQINKLKRWTTRVVIIYDGDRAGREKSEKNKQLLLDKGVKAVTVSLPDGEDLDSFVRNYGREEVRVLVSKAIANL